MANTRSTVLPADSFYLSAGDVVGFYSLWPVWQVCCPTEVAISTGIQSSHRQRHAELQPSPSSHTYSTSTDSPSKVIN